jgi:hypothetical protein
MLLFWSFYDLWQWRAQHETLVDVFKKWVHNGKDKRLMKLNTFSLYLKIVGM